MSTESRPVSEPAPLNSQRETYPYRIVLHETATYADTITELVGSLIEGYDELVAAGDGSDSEETIVARWEYALSVSNSVQQMLAAAATEEGKFDPRNVSEDVLNIVLGNRRLPVEILEWDGPFPLVLLTMHYAPFTTRPVPSGNVLWLDPSNEAALLRSLHAIGVLQHHVAADY